MKKKKHNVQSKVHTEKKEDKNIIITYSMIEQGKNDIMGIGKCLLCFVGIFPFIPLLLSLFSCYVKLIPHHIYRIVFFAVAVVGVIVMFCYMLLWLNNVMTVFLIDEENHLYRLKISVFWYKIKNKMYLLNPGGAVGGRLMRLFYMIQNIKLVLESATEDITFDEFITMGKMERLSDIREVKISRKRIQFHAAIKSQKGVSDKCIKLFRAFEQQDRLCEYLKIYEQEGAAATKRVVFDSKVHMEELLLKKLERSPIKKFVKFTVTWTCIMAWIAAFMLNSDLGRLSKMNAGEYVLVQENDRYDTDDEAVYVNIHNEKDFFRQSDYGKLYKPILILYISPIFVYALMKFTDAAINYAREKSKR